VLSRFYWRILISYNSILQGRFSAGLLSRFSFSPIKNQSNDRLFLPGIAGKKWMLGFRTTILGRIYHNFLFAD